MTDSPTIDKSRPGDLDFAALRQAGIAYVQQLSGKHWTDYNIHDPGVTILELLCYALTDLVYRADFEVADHLTDPTGRIDYEKLALHPPEVILPARATTLNDYRKLIFAAVHELDNVWFAPAPGARWRGLYQVTLRLKEDIEPEKQQAVIDQVRAAYARNRNLCEDIADIIVVRDVECELHARVEIADSAAAAAILARIYYACAKLITAGIRLYPYEEIVRSGKPLDEILTGPFCAHGYIKEEELVGSAQEVLVTDLFAVINELDGVVRIDSLYLEAGGEICEASLRSAAPGTALRLRIPKAAGEIKVELYKDGRPVAVSVKDFLAGYGALNFSRKTRIHRLEDMAALYTPPRGDYREPGTYTTIQNEFPSAYGTNRYGVPASAGPARQARVRQLKGYLVLFEQLIANQRASLHALRELFSQDTGARRSYRFEALDATSIADLEAVYPAADRQRRDAIVGEHDDYPERKGRLLDYLLALYGEALPQEALIHFNVYYGPDELSDALIDNKLQFLHALVTLERDRAAACDYHSSAADGGNMAGLQRKLSLLLGFKQHRERSLDRAFSKRGLQLVSDEAFVQAMEGVWDPRRAGRIEAVGHGEIEAAALPPQQPDGRAGRRQQRIRADFPFLAHGVIGESLLREGISVDAYKVVELGAGEGCELVFKTRRAARGVVLGCYPDGGRAAAAAEGLRRFLVHLNMSSEGLHLVEHILLTPDEKTKGDDGALHGEDDYSFRISIVFPGWSARCRDDNFRSLAEESVQRECPAHIVAEIHWLEFAAYRRFVALHGSWRARKAGGNEGDELRAAARRLRQFLRDRRTENK